MLPENPRSTLHIVGHPLHAMLVPFPVACCVGTLIADDVGNTGLACLAGNGPLRGPGARIIQDVAPLRRQRSGGSCASSRACGSRRGG